MPWGGVAGGPLVPIAAASRVWAAPTLSADSTISSGRVFLATLGSAVITDLAGFYFLLCGAAGGGGGCVESPGINLLGGMAIPVLGTAAGATLAGERFSWAVLGSAVGYAAALAIVVTGAGVDPNDSFALFFALPVLVHSGITTLVLSIR